MKWLKSNRMTLVIVGFAAALVLCGGNANADFTFGEPTNLGSTVNSSAYESGPSLSADGLSLYFRSARIGRYDLWLTTRPTTNDAWKEPMNLGPVVNSSYKEGGPSISFDGLTLYFGSRRPGSLGGLDIWITTRTSVNDPWGEAVNLGPPINSSKTDCGPFLTPDGLSLFFYSRRPGTLGDNDLWISTRTTVNDLWSESVNLGPLINTSSKDYWPNISANGLALFFASMQPGGYGNRDIWMAKRGTIEDEWGTPINLGPMVNSSAEDTSPYISNDSLTLYFASNHIDGHGSYDIWQVPILPVVDLNSDGIVDAADLCIVVDNWGTDEPLCDIGPMP